MATHSSVLTWGIPETAVEPGGLLSMGLHGVGHNGASSLSLFTFMHWRRIWQPTPVFLPGESQWWRSLLGCLLWSCRVTHDWSDLAAAAATVEGGSRDDKTVLQFLRLWTAAGESNILPQGKGKRKMRKKKKERDRRVEW